MNNHYQTQGKPQGPRVIAIVIAAAVLVALVYVMQQGDEEVVEAPPPPVAPAAPEPPAPSPEAARERGDQAREIIARLRAGETNEDLPEIHARAVEFQQQGYLADAYLLYFYAARQGHVPSALTLGRMYDPTGPDDLRSLVDEPIAAQAYKWYRAAAAAGDGGAEDYLANLRGWAEDAAARGDREARQLLMIWQ